MEFQIKLITETIVPQADCISEVGSATKVLVNLYNDSCAAVVHYCYFFRNEITHIFNQCS
jgi:hypothetical protein